MSETKPIMSPSTPAPREMSVGVPAAQPNADDAQQVSVRALGSFHKDGDIQGNQLCQPGDTFSVDRLRASQLRANGLVEYVDAEDDKRIHGETDAKAIAARVEQRRQASEIPANSRTTPLKNPQLGIADLKS